MYVYTYINKTVNDLLRPASETNAPPVYVNDSIAYIIATCYFEQRTAAPNQDTFMFINNILYL